TQNASDIKLKEKKSQENLQLTFYNADIRDSKSISEIFRNENADTCIHLAAKVSVADSIKNPSETMEINVQGTLNVLEACYTSKVKNFIFASSAAVYGDVKELPIKETSALNPLSPYGSSKMLAEQHVSSYKESKKIQKAIMLRIFNVYGEGQHSETDVVSKFASRLSRGLPPIIYGNGAQTRDFVSLDDVVDAIILSIDTMRKDYHNEELGQSSVFNIGTGEPTSINEIAQKIISISGLEIEPEHVEETEETKGIMNSYADITRAKKLINFVAKKGIDEGLRDLLQPLSSKET
ncbi:MAG TPA: GDP-mannose 4,6-dehydratase, partial [Nitrososphaeraceae archaeon]|nr:GDP-mannose 4,6-dehydratase [Nitrososphaeraceae archaeon]